MNQTYSVVISLLITVFVYFYFFGTDNLKSLQFSNFYQNSETQVLAENLNNNVNSLLESTLSSEQLYLLAADLSSKRFYDQSTKVYKEFMDRYPNLIDSDIFMQDMQSLCT